MAKSNIKTYASDYFSGIPDCKKLGNLNEQHRWDIISKQKIKCLRCGFIIEGYYGKRK